MIEASSFPLSPETNLHLTCVVRVRSAPDRRRHPAHALHRPRHRRPTRCGATAVASAPVRPSPHATATPRSNHCNRRKPVPNSRRRTHTRGTCRQGRWCTCPRRGRRREPPCHSGAAKPHAWGCGSGRKAAPWPAQHRARGRAAGPRGQAAVCSSPGGVRPQGSTAGSCSCWRR